MGIKTVARMGGVISLAGLVLAGCAAIPTNPQAKKVLVSNAPAPKKCHFLGMITGNQGNFFTGKFTSNKNMQTGAFNSLRNQAYAMGGNRVVLLMKQASMTEDRNGGAQTNVALSGNVFKCPNQG